LNEEYSFDLIRTKNEPNEPKHEPNEPNREPNCEKTFNLTEDEKRVLMFIKENPTITQKALVETIGTSLSTIKRILTKLKKAGILVRIGNKRSGKWVVREER